jgi:hypothetical protein
MDKLSLYVNRVLLPKKYQKCHPSIWQTEWLLSEMNAEVRRLLIQVIGYEIIVKELQARELDVWQEYRLLRIDANVDVEPIFLLKMTCPSTGYIHAMRVPPDVRSAREAIKWVNWGVDPEEFSVQS